jgi:hypothetical protein
MRQATLARTAERVASGHSLDRALREFLDEFYPAPTPEQRSSMRLDEPPAMENPCLESLFGAVAEYLAHQYGLPHVPDWAYSPRRYLDRAWHVSSISDDGMRECLTFSSPAEFASRNILTEERPLQPARRPRPPENESR